MNAKSPYQPPCTEAQFAQAMRRIEAQELVTAMAANEQGLFVLRDDGSEAAARITELVREAVAMGLIREKPFCGQAGYCLVQE